VNQGVQQMVAIALTGTTRHKLITFRDMF